MSVMEETLPPQRRGFLSVLAGMIIRPRRTLEYLRENGGNSWLFMALISLILVILPVLVAAPLTTEITREAIQAQMEIQGNQSGAITPEIEAQALSFATNPLFTMVMPSIAGVIGLALLWLLWAGGLHLVGTITGGSNTFGQIWRAVVWSWLPFSLRGLIQTIYILGTQQLITNPGLSGLVADQRTTAELVTSPPTTGQLVLQSFLGQIDLFLFWNLVLLIIGLAVMARVSTRKSILITLGVWVIITLVTLLPSLAAGILSSSFSGM